MQESNRSRHAGARAMLAVLSLASLLGAVVVASAGAQQGGEPMSQDAMNMMMALATPGEHHKKLDRWVGDWDATIKMWTGPGKPTVSKGTVHYEWILGGRYVLGRWTGEVGGMPFQGMEIDGYDNAKGQYVSTWLDNMSTWPMTLTGRLLPDGSGMTYVGSSYDPMQKKDVGVREEIRWPDDRHYTFEMFMTGTTPDGKPTEMKSMEIVGEKK